MKNFNNFFLILKYWKIIKLIQTYIILCFESYSFINFCDTNDIIVMIVYTLIILYLQFCYSSYLYCLSVNSKIKKKTKNLHVKLFFWNVYKFILFFKWFCYKWNIKFIWMCVTNNSWTTMWGTIWPRLNLTIIFLLWLNKIVNNTKFLFYGLLLCNK